ncbi:TauD/TfdA family dioxygenase [Orrella sp. NBD-18]|uniref:TauD/TfdA family dioxygenase n=1 Tax=Sheuella amnicola TaxID=2707330 RepID=A0A6B2QZ10_9BURK|nr:TauD/TfdA family dioxygenase [Sheuella amnicola]NDY82514.1 TauD/TfdA family dioxygenase [Sheuella amnicola]
MINVTPSGQGLGARVENIDLSQPLSAENYKTIEGLLGKYGVLCFPKQQLSSQQLKDYSSNFGSLEINVANVYQEPGLPEVMILSNKKVDGKPIGLGDAGQDWHTDMSYSKMIAFTNVLYGIEIPRRNGEPLGSTEFSNMRAAYLALPEDLKTKLDGMTVLHDFNKFWENMRKQPGSTRAPLTEEQRKAKPPVSHPIFLTHPITGEKVLYANPGYSIRINELPEEESDRILAFLFEHQLQPQFRYRHRWTEGDVLMWDNMGTIHNAIADYKPDEPRYIKRCQVMADRYFPQAA